MAFDKNQLMIKELTAAYGAYADPSILTVADDIEDDFTEEETVGYVRMGSQVLNLNDTFAEYKAGTPHRKIRKDLTERLVGFTFIANQFNADTLNLLLNTLVESGAYDHAWLGSDAPVKARKGWLFKGTLVDGTTEIKIGLWAAEVTTEDKSPAWSGEDYVDVPVTLECFEGSEWEADPTLAKTKNYGMIQIDATT